MTADIIEQRNAYERTLTKILQNKVDIIFNGRTIHSVTVDKYREVLTFIFTDGTVCDVQCRDAEEELTVYRKVEP